MHKNSLEQMRLFRDKYIKSVPLSVLDVGSYDMNGSYKPLFTNHNYTGLDICTGPNVDLAVSDPYHWPIEDAAFDMVISGQALEHIEQPWRTLQEIARVLKPGGICCLIAPAIWPEHKAPLDCYRYYPDGLRALTASAGIECIECYLSPMWPGLYGRLRKLRGLSPLLADTVFVGKKCN